MDGTRRAGRNGAIPPVTQAARLLRVVAVALCTLLAGITPALAQDGERSLNFIDLHQGSALSDLIRSISSGSYDLSGGEFQSVAPWYQTYWRDLSAEWLLQLGPDDGILWGFSTGEHGEKYSIDPAITLGVITQMHPSPKSTLSLTVSTILGGHLTEHPCIADYGFGDGPEPVNCRLADTEIKASETLKYLFNEDPSRLNISITYSVAF
jgi:hypothetical protein